MIFKKWFKKRKPPPNYDGDFTALAKCIDPIIDRVANEMFHSYMDILISRPSSYIVPAIWAHEDSVEIDPIAREINRMVGPALHSVFVALDLTKPKRSQILGISYLVRGLIISKVAFMVEAFKNRPLGIEQTEGPHTYELRDMQPLGSA